MIILAVQGSGKSFAAAKRTDTADVDRLRGRESLDDYIERLLSEGNSHKYVLGNLRHDIASALDQRGEKITLFAPFRENMADDEYQEIKERIFGRLILRKEQNAYTCRYIEDFKAGYDTWNTEKFYADLSGYESYICMDRNIDTVSKLLDYLDKEENK